MRAILKRWSKKFPALKRASQKKFLPSYKKGGGGGERKFRTHNFPILYAPLPVMNAGASFPGHTHLRVFSSNCWVH